MQVALVSVGDELLDEVRTRFDGRVGSYPTRGEVNNRIKVAGQDAERLGVQPRGSGNELATTDRTGERASGVRECSQSRSSWER